MRQVGYSARTSLREPDTFYSNGTGDGDAHSSYNGDGRGDGAAYGFVDVKGVFSFARYGDGFSYGNGQGDGGK